MNRIFDTRSRLRMTVAEMGEYMGVSLHTVRNWEADGTSKHRARAIPPSAHRMLDILATIETLAPGIHAALLPQSYRERMKG